MFAIFIVGALSILVLSAWATVIHWVSRHSERKPPSLTVIESGRAFRS